MKDPRKEVKTTLSQIEKSIARILKKQGIKTSEKIRVVLVKKDTVEVLMPEYFTYIDSGRKPNSRFPPLRTIMRWIDKKGLSTPVGMTRKGFAFIIARSIANKGIAAKPFIDNLRLTVIDLVTQTINNTIDYNLKEISK